MGYWTGSTAPAYPDRYPDDDAIDVPSDGGLAYTLGRWVGPPSAYYYKTYLNGQESDILEANLYGAFQWYPDLEPNTSYDWYMEAYADDGETVIATAPTWTFTTAEEGQYEEGTKIVSLTGEVSLASQSPPKASTPTPATKAKNIEVGLTEITWEV